ncbi:MAG TPA: hypothetical protein VD927_03815 [Chryseosolibacter sp.]|nr:hypothetical protein [Chryseosolibacter sp.]
MMKKFLAITIVLLCVCASYAWAQRIKYKELVPALDTSSISEQMSLLKLYLAEELDHGNANFRLAMLHYNIFRNSDPLLEYSKAVAHAKEAVLRLTKAKVVVTTQDVRSDNEYYAPFFKTLDSKGRPYAEFSIVQAKINTAFDSAQQFLEKMPPIYSSFTKSVQQYDNAVKIFADINTDYKTLEDLYMFFDDELNKRFDQLKSSYDSSVSNFNKYTSLTKDYPLQNYRQKANIKEINVYRLDGLTTRLTFLEDNVEFWNYANWVDNVRKMYNTEIVAIKDKIVQTETRLNESLKALETNEVPGESLFKISKDLVFQLNNYDKSSLALALLEYKAFKQNWLAKTHQIKRDTAIETKLELYSHLIQLNRVADSLAHDIKSKINSGSTKKHGAYLKKFYGGPSGLDKVVQNETAFISKTFADYQETLKGTLLAYNAKTDVSDKTLKIGSFNVPLFVDNRPDSAIDLVSVVTQRIVKNPDGSIYVAGVHKMNKKTNNNLTGFVAKLNPDGKPAWLKELNFNPDSLTVADANNYIGDLVSTQEGCAVVVTSIRPSAQQLINTFVFINDKGEMSAYPVKEKGMARKLIYQESSNSFVMIFKGDSARQQYHQDEMVSIASLNILGDLLWHQDFTFAGTIEDVVTVRDGYILTGNYTALKDLKGKESRTKINQGQSNPYLIKISLRGEKLSVLPLNSPKSIYIDKVVKVNDGSINLLGYESTFDAMADPTATRGAVLHMMTAYDLRQICSNFN